MMTRTLKILSIAACGSLFSLTTASAIETFAMQENPRIFRGIRSAGMGGIITTTGNYSEALFANPARHSEVDTWKWTLLEIQPEVNTTLLSTSSNLSAIRASSGANTISSASKLIGQNEHAGIQMMTAYYNPHFIGDLGFAAALLFSVHTNLMVNYTTDIDSQTILDTGPNVGFSHPFFDNTLSLGFNLHMLYRVATDGVFNSIDFLTGSKLSLQNFGKQGIGIDADLGAYYHVPWEIPFMRISLGASLNNLNKSHYDDVNAQFLVGVGSRPINNDRVFNAGIRFDFPDTWIMTAPLVAIEFQDNGDTNKRNSFAKKTHIGGEAKLTRVISFRLGLNQGYAAAGLGIDLPVVKLDFATYGEELSGNAGQEEDRRLLFRLAFEI